MVFLLRRIRSISSASRFLCAANSNLFLSRTPSLLTTCTALQEKHWNTQASSVSPVRRTSDFSQPRFLILRAQNGISAIAHYQVLEFVLHHFRDVVAVVAHFLRADPAPHPLIEF